MISPPSAAGFANTTADASGVPWKNQTNKKILLMFYVDGKVTDDKPVKLEISITVNLSNMVSFSGLSVTHRKRIIKGKSNSPSTSV